MKKLSIVSKTDFSFFEENLQQYFFLSIHTQRRFSKRNKIKKLENNKTKIHKSSRKKNVRKTVHLKNENVSFD